MFEATITVGNLLTAVAVVISASGLVYAWRKDGALKEKEYSDRIRKSAALVLAKLERWRQLALTLFDSLQVAMTEADRKILENQDTIDTRDFFWKELVSARARVREKIIEEKIELVFADLYGYDPRIHSLFEAALSRVRHIERQTFIALLDETQADILGLENDKKPFFSAQLGNALRMTAGKLEQRASQHMEQVLHPFRTEILKLVRSNDRSIVRKEVSVSSAEDILPPESDLFVGDHDRLAKFLKDLEWCRRDDSYAAAENICLTTRHLFDSFVTDWITPKPAKFEQADGDQPRATRGFATDGEFGGAPSDQHSPSAGGDSS